MKLKLFILIATVLFMNSVAYGQDPALMQWADSVGMVPPLINTKPHKKYNAANLDYGMTIGIERTPKGRIWACWVGGGDNADGFFVMAWSDNDGKKWSKTKVVVDPHHPDDPLKRRTLVGQLWTDPKGRLWLFFDLAVTYFDGRSGGWCTVCENPDAANPIWSAPRYIGFGCTLQKPMAASTGEYALSVSLWKRAHENTALEKGWTENPLKGAHPELDSLRGAHIFVSTDEGATWQRRAKVNFPQPSFDEHLFIEQPDGTWWMTARTGLGIHQCFSKDRGFTWTPPELYQPHVNSRHFILRLASGNLLLVRHGMPDEKLPARSHLRAFISQDEGKTWQGNLLLDERTGVSYPTGFQTPDGYIYISYDHQRTAEGDVLMARFNETDILSQKIVSPRGSLLMVISKPGKVKQSAANIEARMKATAK